VGFKGLKERSNKLSTDLVVLAAFELGVWVNRYTAVLCQWPLPTQETAPCLMAISNIHIYNYSLLSGLRAVAQTISYGHGFYRTVLLIRQCCNYRSRRHSRIRCPQYRLALAQHSVRQL
jgi:hypothetical protein